ncbi:unnamed protein product [Caenorhabditis sp. 36 PRJEB53466]|nr:unnamed protein product [Caenorhabditis sp. 36 PRJEB53466]
MSTKEAQKIKKESTGSNGSASLGMTTPTAAGLTSNLDLADPSSVWGMKSTQPMLMATPTAYSFPTSNYFFTGGPTTADLIVSVDLQVLCLSDSRFAFHEGILPTATSDVIEKLFIDIYTSFFCSIG